MKLILPIAAAMMIAASAHGLAQVGTWENINPPGHTGNYSGLAFPTRDTGYAVSTPGNFSDPRSTIMKTTDGGDTWSLGSLEGVWASDLAFFNADHGFAPGQNLSCGCASLETTTDGGATWTEKTFPDTKGFHGIRLLNATTGIIDGAGSTIYRTTDAGATWKKIAIDLGGDVSLGGISFPTPMIGYMLGAVKGRTVVNVLYKTTDGGITWKQIYDGGATSTTLYQNLDFVTPEIGFITGRADSKAIYKTVDGGITWKRVYKPALPETAVMAGVAFPNARIGYACGSDGTILNTKDSGATWQLENFSGGATLSALAFTDEKNGVAGGLFGVLLKRTPPEAPTAALDHSSLDFGTVPANRTKELAATISAANDAGLRIRNITLNQQDGAAFTLLEPAGGFPIDITPDQPLTLRFRFAPATAGTAYSATATIETNDEANGTLRMNLHGDGSVAVASVDDNAPSPRPGINCLPNPIAGNAILTIDLPHASGSLHAALFNTLGQPIVTLHDGPAAAGTHSFTLNAGRLPAGLYYCIVRAGDLTGVREITITR